MKTCPKCEEVKEESCFHKDSSNKRGLSSYCKLCSKTYSEAYAALAKKQRAEAKALLPVKSDREKKLERARKVRDKARVKRMANPARAIFQTAKAASKRLGRDFSITEEDIVVPEFCPVLGIPLSFAEYGRHDASPALDRIDNSLGYIPGNVIVVSWRANRLKNDASLAEMVALSDFYLNLSKTKSILCASGVC
jgi:hypothetical protein